MSHRDSKRPLLADEHQPAPVLVEVVGEAAEVRTAARVDAREVGAAARTRPRAVSDADRPIAVGRGVGGLEGLAPLPFGGRALPGELRLDLVEGAAVADRDEFEPTGLRSRHGQAGVLPALGVVIAVTLDHLDGLVLRRVAVEGELEDLALGGVSGSGFHERLLLSVVGARLDKRTIVSYTRKETGCQEIGLDAEVVPSDMSFLDVFSFFHLFFMLYYLQHALTSEDSSSLFTLPPTGPYETVLFKAVTTGEQVKKHHIIGVCFCSQGSGAVTPCC